MKTAWLAGASGLVGGELLERLLADASFDRVIAVGRRALPRSSPKLESVEVDFADPKSFEGLAPPVVAFSCLGSTIKKAGSKQAFEAVDLDAVVTFAKAALDHGAKTFVHVSSLGADPRSRTFYSSVKGRAEAAVAALGFDTVVALRPSILDGERGESRPLERIGLGIARVLGPFLGKYRPTPVSAVARTMIAATRMRGVHVIDAADVHA